MKNVVVNHLMKSVIKYKNFDDIKLKEIKYGIETFYLTITKTIIIFSIAYVLNLLKTLLLLMCFYTVLRLNGFGLHAKKSWQCWIGSIIIFLLIPYLCIVLHISKYIQFFVGVACSFFIYRFAPADTEKRPIINSKKRYLHKILCFITSMIYLLLLIFIKDYYLRNIIFFSLLLETVLILPISYKIFNLKYDNYKNYVSSNC